MPAIEIQTSEQPVQIKTKPERSCMDCTYILSGTTGDFCHMFYEDIWDYSVAMECDSFAP